MKKRLIALLCIAACTLLLCACSVKLNCHSERIDGVAYLVDMEADTVSDGVYTYPYTLSGKAENRTVAVSYPNGASYISTHSGSTWEGPYDPQQYAPGGTLTHLILEGELGEVDSLISPWKLVLVIALAAFGVLNIIKPRVMWFLAWGWHYRDAEPSDAALVVGKVVGVIAVAVAVILLFS